MRHRHLPLCAFLFTLSAFLASCAKNEYTGRRQLMLLDRETELELGAQAYQEALAGEQKLTDDPRYVDPVEAVALRLAAEVEKGWRGIEPPRFQWEFHVVDEPKTANAWCLPGGKIAVYTGIFPACADRNGLAVVLGHEIMHAVLQHGNERVSQGMAAEIGTGVLGAILGGDDPKQKEMVHGLLGLGVGVGVMLPFSREHETEADRLGLQLAARAGFDPRAGVEVWDRMGRMNSGGEPPEFLSTHPNSDTRIENMKDWMAEAMEMYEASEKQVNKPLPAPGHASTRIAKERARGGVTAQSARRSEIEKTEVALFEFRTQRALFVEAARVEGPEGVDVTVETRTGVPANQQRAVSISRPKAGDPPLPSGDYTVTLHGNIDGRPWTETLKYQLR